MILGIRKKKKKNSRIHSSSEVWKASEKSVGSNLLTEGQGWRG